eukprot:TRINITY_DN8415_c0_g1_i1.p1 TRINITY_DN8415_c0_g1~~TRINITY_DN8415_c0_g1_i1.p1  ORF type:complete len:221 (+),score=63.75 TRINITY_DN8415_c0_g1_i1:198-860(+)
MKVSKYWWLTISVIFTLMTLASLGFTIGIPIVDWKLSYPSAGGGTPIIIPSDGSVLTLNGMLSKTLTIYRWDHDPWSQTEQGVVICLKQPTEGINFENLQLFANEGNSQLTQSPEYEKHFHPEDLCTAPLTSCGGSFFIGISLNNTLITAPPSKFQLNVHLENAANNCFRIGNGNVGLTLFTYFILPLLVVFCCCCCISAALWFGYLNERNRSYHYKSIQ